MKLALLVLLAFVLVGCAYRPQVCIEPYINDDFDCCLDDNRNNVCDEDEPLPKFECREGTEPVYVSDKLEEETGRKILTLDELRAYYSDIGQIEASQIPDQEFYDDKGLIEGPDGIYYCTAQTST